MSQGNITDQLVSNTRFLSMYSNGGKSFAYHSVLTNLLPLTKSQAEVINILKKAPKKVSDLLHEKITEQDLNSLVNNGFIVSKDINEQERLKTYFKNNLDVEFGLMYLLVTDSCNLRCKYCFVENPLPANHNFTSMTPELAKRGIDLFVSNLSKNQNIRRNVCIYGGEPLVNRETTHSAIRYLGELDCNPKIHTQLITNGTLMTPETAKILADYGVDVAISIDGTEEVTNKTRPMASKGNTYCHIQKAWEQLKNAGCKNLSISLTLTRENVPGLRENVEHLLEEFHPNGFGFNFLLGKPCELIDCSIDMDYTTNQVIETFKYLREKGIPEDRMMRKIRAFVTKKPQLKDCGGVGNQIVVSSDGYVGPCQAFASSKLYFRPIGELERKDLTKDPIFTEWGTRYPLNLEECLNCEAIGICGGGCPYQSYLTEGSIFKLDTRMCQHNKKVLEWMINETIKDGS